MDNMENSTIAEAKSRPRPDSSVVKPPRKRKRIVISCTECHRRKQKCDRASPCSNCVARNKQSLCHYENESARRAQLLEEGNGATGEDGFGVIKSADSDQAAQVTAFGYAKSNGNNNTTLGIFKKLESYDANSPSLTTSFLSRIPDQSGLKEKYKSYIRQLPSKPFIEQLVATYFREVNWQYYPLDEGTFRDTLKGWHNLSFTTLNKGPLELPPDLQSFPALLFQVLALALQYQPADYENETNLDSLKYAAGMSLDDLANDYSESGCQILCLLGKRNTTLVTVQAGFLRCALLKNTGLVTESWHYLSQTIRDGQEIGLHKANSGLRPRGDEKPEGILENLWMEQFRRRMWLVLSLWDIHMAIVLGRPTTIDCRDGKPAFPIDAPIPKNRREVAPAPRSSTDPPTSLTMLLWSAELSAPLWDIFSLEKEDPNQANIGKLEDMHRMIKSITLHCPPYFRATNPDTSFDSHPECYWLPRCRPLFQNSAAFTIMALHRPYIFTHAASRTAALRAGLDILRAQRVFFSVVNVTQHKSHSLVLNTFDAIVLVAAIYILHPSENREELDDTLQHFEWAMERFQVISARNVMALSALNVLKAIYARLKKALEKSPHPYPSSNTSTTSNSTPALPTPESTASVIKYDTSTTSPANGTVNGYTLPTISNLTESTPTTQPVPTTWDLGPMAMPQAFDFSSMQPLQPMHDLLYNDLGTVDGNTNSAIDPSLQNVGSGRLDANGGWTGMGTGGQWQFEGAFADDSFWGFMNNYAH